MSHLRILIVRVTDEKQPEQTTELHRIDLPAADPGQLAPETALNQLEATALDTGQTVMRHLLVDQWQELDQLLVACPPAAFSPSGACSLMALPASKSPVGWASCTCRGRFVTSLRRGRTRCPAMRSYRPTTE